MDNFEFELVGNDNRPFRGYESTPDPTSVSFQVAVKGSQNVYKHLSGRWANRFGMKRYDAADATLAGIASSFDWNTSLNMLRIVRVVAQTSAGSDGKLQVLSSITGSPIWYTLLSGLSYTRFVFDAYFDTTALKDFLLFVQHDFNMYKWDGGITLIASGDINTITKLDASTTWAQDGFAAMGTVTINGVDYAYTGGTNSATLTGVTTDATSLVSGSVGVSKVTSTSNSPASGFFNDFIKVIGNRLHVGSYTSRLIYISSNIDYTNFTVPTPRSPGDPELLTLDNAAKGISVSKGNAVISAGTSDWYVVQYIDQSIGSASAPLSVQQTKVDKKPTSVLGAALAHEFIDTQGDSIIYLSQDQQVRNFGTFRELTTDKYPSLSQAVQTELFNQNFTGGCLRCIGDFIRLTAPVNGVDYLYQARESVDDGGNIVAERLWHSPHGRNLTRFSVIDGEIHGHSNGNPQLYQLENTGQWHDDSPTGDSLPYTSILLMAYQHIVDKSGHRRQGLLYFDKLFYEGLISNGTNLYGNIYFDYQGSTDFQQVDINTNAKPAKFFTSANPLSLGLKSLGDDPLGDGLILDNDDEVLLPKFRAIRKVNPKNCFEYALGIMSQDADSRWELRCLGANQRTSPQQAVFLQ